MRFIFWVRPLKYLFFLNYWGLRTGPEWVYPPDKYAVIFDMGIISVGYVIR